MLDNNVLKGITEKMRLKYINYLNLYFNEY